MTTINKLIDRVLLNLESYNTDSTLYAVLSEAITSTDTTFTLIGPEFNDGSGFSRGVMEIGNELVYVNSFDRTTSTASNVIRGFKGTVASDWAENTMIKNNPPFPINVIVDAMNDTIKGLYPRIVAVSQFEFKGIGGVAQYRMPKGAISVLSAKWLPNGASKAWLPITKWSYTNFGGSNAPLDSDTFFGNKTINIMAPATGRPIQIVYTTEPKTFLITELTTEGEDGPVELDFSSTLLPDWTEEIVIFGTCWRLASFLDSNKVNQTVAEQSLINSSGTPLQSGGSAITLAKYFLGLFEQQIQLGTQRQSKELPTVKHRI